MRRVEPFITASISPVPGSKSMKVLDVVLPTLFLTNTLLLDDILDAVISVETAKFPITSNLEVGVEVPIPKLELLLIKLLSILFNSIFESREEAALTLII